MRNLQEEVREIREQVLLVREVGFDEANVDPFHDPMDWCETLIEYVDHLLGRIENLQEDIDNLHAYLDTELL